MHDGYLLLATTQYMYNSATNYMYSGVSEVGKTQCEDPNCRCSYI